MKQEVEIVDQHAYQEFIYCPYCLHRHTHIPNWENWGPVFKVICYKCSLVFTARIVRLVIHDGGDKVWLGTGFDTERDDNNPLNQEFSPTGRNYSHDPPIQNVKGSIADMLDKFFWR